MTGVTPASAGGFMVAFMVAANLTEAGAALKRLAAVIPRRHKEDRRLRERGETPRLCPQL